MSDPVCVSIILSDFVICEQGTRKNSLIGVFNNLNGIKFPWPSPLFFVTVALTNLPPDTKNFNLTVRIEHPVTGHVLTSLGGEIKFGEPSNLSKELVFEVSFPVVPFLIPSAGHYEVTVLFNNSSIAKRLLTVNSITAPGTSPQ